jgi:hypothetical protein
MLTQLLERDKDNVWYYPVCELGLGFGKERLHRWGDWRGFTDGAIGEAIRAASEVRKV